VWTCAVESALHYGTVHTVNVKGVAMQAVKALDGEDAWLHTLLNEALGGGV